MRFKQYYTESVKHDNTPINEGGGFGHIAHVTEMQSWTFKKLKEFVNDALTGNLTNVTEKTDGMNLLVTYKDGEIKSARNKGNLKESGKTAMTMEQLSDKFAGRGAVNKAFAHAMLDLGTAFRRLSEEKLNEIFQEGKRFLSIEIIFEETTNVIPYGFNEITMQQLIEYDAKGNIVNYGSSDALYEMLDVTELSTFNINKLRPVKFSIMENLEEHKKMYIEHIDSLMSETNMTDSDTLKTFYNITECGYNTYNAMVGTISLLGNVVLSNMSSYMAVNPSQVTERVIARLEDTINKIKSSGDEKLIEKMNEHIIKFDRSGGKLHIQPTEGITFIYEGQLLKLTGAYSSVNQILGLVPYTF